MIRQARNFFIRRKLNRLGQRFRPPGDPQGAGASREERGPRARDAGEAECRSRD